MTFPADIQSRINLAFAVVIFVAGGFFGLLGGSILDAARDPKPQNRVLMAFQAKDRPQADGMPPICLQDILDMVPPPSRTVPIHVQTVGGHELPFVGVSTQIDSRGNQVGIVFKVDAKDKTK